VCVCVGGGGGGGGLLFMYINNNKGDNIDDARNVFHSCGMLFLSSIRYWVGECAKGTQN
jgi:hypothetical protein